MSATGNLTKLPRIGEVMNLGGEPTITILANQNNLLMFAFPRTSNVVLMPHRGNFLLQPAETITENQKQ